MRLALCAVALALVLPGAALAEIVPGTAGADDGALALVPGGGARVAAIVGGRLVLASRDPAGPWTSSQAPALPSGRGLVAGLAAAANGRVYVLVEEASGRWLVLVERAGPSWRMHILVRRVANRGVLGLAGLALDRAGRAIVAYAVAYPSRKTFLRLVRPDRRGRYVARAVTLEGFPPSQTVPSAAPVVLPGGEVRVVETFSGAAIEWAPKGKTWEGQFLHIAPLGSPAGRVAAAADGAGVWSAWTELYPSFGESHVLLTLHLDGERTSILHRHAFLVALAPTGTVPEVAANDYVTAAALGAPGGVVAYAGLVLAGAAPLELAAKLVDYAAEPGGAARQLLLAGAAGLEWYRAEPLAPVQVSLAATPGAGAVALAGRVDGGSGGSVELYRLRPGAAAELAATVALAPDGSFAATDAPGPAPLFYRAVYRAAPDALPYGALLRSPVAPA